MLMYARKTSANLFQKLVGVWLFANSASFNTYRIMNRMGISISYSSVLRILLKLSVTTQLATATAALTFLFMLIYDNINRRLQRHESGIGLRPAEAMNGTAATLIVLEGASPEAFDLQPLRDARAANRRSTELTTELLLSQIDHEHNETVMSLHVMGILCDELGALGSEYREWISTKFAASAPNGSAVHPRPPGQKNKIYPMRVSNIKEGTLNGNRDVLIDNFISELKLPKDLVASSAQLVGADQATIAMLNNLKRLLAQCPHGFESFEWVLPFIALWHMAWADLARITNTHWGAKGSNDPTTLSAHNIILGRGVKAGTARPDFYAAQRLGFDVLRAEILDCWR